MGSTKTLITENDYVELLRPVERWPAGTRGTAVSDHGASKLVEVSDDQGVMLDLLEVDEVDLELITAYPSVPPPSRAMSLRH
ncbi:MAG: hypothetical protein QOF06_1737 [Solirubrobacterales bacterium]|jgi:hypothetical protein|nr:hypothetical protein [Solirubrobacterales bacterium]